MSASWHKRRPWPRHRPRHEVECWLRNCFAADAPPRALLIQQAELAKLAGDDTETQRLLKLAENTPLRDATSTTPIGPRPWRCTPAPRKRESLLEDATRLMPDHFGAWRLRALWHQSAGDFRKAESCWDTCVALKPGDEWSRLCRGQTYLQMRKYADAQQDFDAFLKKHPTYRDAYLQRAVASEKQASLPDADPDKQKEHRANAINDLTKAIDLGRASPELLFRRFELMEKNNDEQGAERDRVRLLSSEPSDLDGWIYRGMVQAKNNPKAALADLERVLAAERDNVTALYHKAILLADRLDRPVEAAGALNRLLIADPRHPDALLKRGLAPRQGRHSRCAGPTRASHERRSVSRRAYQAACIFAFTSSSARRSRARHRAAQNRMRVARERSGQGRPDLPIAHIPEAVELLRAPFLGPVPSPKD